MIDITSLKVQSLVVLSWLGANISMVISGEIKSGRNRWLPTLWANQSYRCLLCVIVLFERTYKYRPRWDFRDHVVLLSYPVLPRIFQHHHWVGTCCISHMQAYRGWGAHFLASVVPCTCLYHEQKSPLPISFCLLVTPLQNNNGAFSYIREYRHFTYIEFLSFSRARIKKIVE